MTIYRTPSSNVLDVTTQIVSSFTRHHIIDHSELPDLIKLVYYTLSNIDTLKRKNIPFPKSKISADQSIKPDYIVCLEDGKRMKVLKRHLRTYYNLSPEAYRRKWGLPSDYPMVAPNYAQKRAAYARRTPVQ